LSDPSHSLEDHGCRPRSPPPIKQVGYLSGHGGLTQRGAERFTVPDVDDFHESAIVSAGAFARAIAAVDEKPLLVVLNSCHSAAQTEGLVETVPFAIGMAKSIGDVDAITYAARFYAAIAEGQSVQGAHLLGRAAVEMNGLPDHEVPTLTCAPDVDPSATRLVTPPPASEIA
jgi:hypothetical protein